MLCAQSQARLKVPSWAIVVGDLWCSTPKFCSSWFFVPHLPDIEAPCFVKFSTVFQGIHLYPSCLLYHDLIITRLTVRLPPD